MQTNNTRINELFIDLNSLDIYSQKAVLRAWHYAANAACLTAAMRYVTDAPDAGGIDGFNKYEAARSAAVNDADESNLPALLQLQSDIDTALSELADTPRSFSDTLQFMQSTQKPTREQCIAEYKYRTDMGSQPRMTVNQFVDFEFERKMQQYERLLARGDDAARLCETMSFDHNRGYNDIPEWLIDKLETKLVEKLHACWSRFETTVSNPRMTARIRDTATADQLLVGKVLAKYDVDPATVAIKQSPDVPFETAAGDLSSIKPRVVSPSAVVQ